ncbi:isoprenyl transferase [Thermoproteota archaeon]
MRHDKECLDADKMPVHIAIIMDGNGRWAKKRFLPRQMGHKAGAEALRATLKTCAELGILYLSVYVFSTENWKRPEKEVSFLMTLFKYLVAKELPELKKQGVRVQCLGDWDRIPLDVKDKFNEIQNETKENTRINLNLMVNYGSRHEILSACRKVCENKTKDQIQALTEEEFSSFLYSKDCPDPDILIRTGGDYRISNFMLWQIAYSELFVLDTLWPDFKKDQLIQVIKEFQIRERRFGGIKL